MKLVEVESSVLQGKILDSIIGLEEGKEEVIFTCMDGTKYIMYHWQVSFENVCQKI